MREWNTKLILRLIREGGSTSQVDILRKSGLSAGTVANISHQLRRQGFILSAGPGKSKGGRPPITFRFNPKARYVLSVAFFADETRAAVLDLAGNIHGRTSFSTSIKQSAEVIVAQAKPHMDQILSAANIPQDKIISLCATFEGIVDQEAGRLILSSNLGWRDVPVQALLEQIFGIKTFIESEGRAIALGEYSFGAGKGAKNMLSVDIDAGIGASVISNGQIYRGFHQMEGEFGHNMILPDGPVCRCGRIGCLEAIASGSAIIRQVAQSHTASGQPAIHPTLLNMPQREAMRSIFTAARSGNELVLPILKSAGAHLGKAIANLVNHTDPELVVLCGYVAEDDPGIFLPMIQGAFEENVFGKELREIRLVQSKLREDAVLIGGATLAYQDMVRC